MFESTWPDRRVYALDQSGEAAAKPGFESDHIVSCYHSPFAGRESECLVEFSVMKRLQDNDCTVDEFARVGNRGIFVVPYGKLEISFRLGR